MPRGCTLHGRLPQGSAHIRFTHLKIYAPTCAPDSVATLAIHSQPAADIGKYGGATPGEDNYVARVIVDVMLKPEIHDPQGEAVLSAAHRLGFGNVTGVRQGKRFEVELDGPADGAALAAVEELARELLANQVIEEFSLHTTE
jgi:phosphoribosylformylglycinamidine synthase subunit PurS